MVYVVVKTAVYDHGVGGVFETLEEAKSAADKLAAADRDAHHDYDVFEYKLGCVAEQTETQSMRVPEVIYTVHK